MAAAEGEVVKRKLQELRVIDLKAELEKRGLEKAGVKAVLLERMQQALQKDGHDPDEYLFEVINEVTPIKKPSKRTNKKLTRDDESETHSNIDESQNDLVLDDDEKMDSDDDRIDEKFFQVLEATDGGEDAIDLSIEEGDKLLIDEDYVGSGEKEEQVEVSDEKNKKQNGEESRKGDSTSSDAAASGESAAKSNNTEEKEDAPSVKGDDHGSLVVHVEDAQRDLDSEMTSSALASGEEEALTNGEQVGKDSKMELSVVKKPSDDVPKKTEGKAASTDKAPAISKGDESETGDKNKTSTSDKSETKSPAKGGKQEEEKPAISASSKAKSSNANGKDGKNAVDRSKVVRPAVSAKNLWVTGLSSTTRATDLKALFSKHGKVIGAKIVSNARSSVSRCYGFVTMATIEEASKCIQYLHRTELHGRMISVEKAKGEPVGPAKRKDVKPVATAKKVPEKKEAGAQAKAVEAGEKNPDDSDKKEKAKEDTKVQDKEAAEKKDGNEAKATDAKKVQEKPTESVQEDKSAKKEEDKEKRDSSRKGSTSRLSSKERSSRERHLHPRMPAMKPGFRRRPFFRRPLFRQHEHASRTLTFHRIREERIRQRQREEEREMRESERRRRQDIVRQREIERKQREEAIRLERERERLRIERERLERERAEVLRLEREKQRMERERIEREREELRRRERLRVDDHRRPFKRPFETFRSNRDVDFDDRKRPFIPNNSRRVDTFDRKNDRFGDSTRRDIGNRDSSLHDRSSRFERGPLPRDTDLRGHGRDDRGMSFRDGSDSIGQSRPTPKDDWKGSQDRRGHHGVTRADRFDSGKGVSGSMNFVSDRGGDSWHGGVSQSDSRGSGSKPYSSGGGMQSRDSWGGDRKSEGQSWGRSDGQGDRWGSSVSSGSRGQQSMGLSPSLLPQPSSGMFESSSSSAGMMGMGVGGSSYGSERFDAYKSMSSMRRF